VSDEEDGTPVDAVRRLVQRFYDDMWNPFDVSVLEHITAPDVTFRGSLGDVTTGRAELTGYVRKVQSAFPDFHNEVVELVAEEGRGFARLRYTGTHLGPLGDLAPTGRRIAYEGTARFELSDGVIADVWVLGDRVTLYQQLGHPLAPGSQGQGA
jgi:steroid delta-isomerase-like uncharacterized protein